MRPSGLESAEYERLIDLCPGVLFRQRADFSFDYISAKIKDWTGFSPEEWLRQPKLVEEAIYESDTTAFAGHLAACGKSDEVTQIVFRIRNRKTGRIRWISERKRAIRGRNGSIAGFEGVWDNVSTLALAARQLDAATWHNTFGLVTMGAAHDLNNKLAGILSWSDLYVSELDPGNPLFEGLTAIRKTAQTASQLVHQLAALHEAASATREHIDLNQFVTALREVLRRVVSSRVKIETALHNEPLTLHVDQGRLQRLMIGWALWAAARMPKRGSLSLQTSRAVREGKEFAALTLSDTGGEVAMASLSHADPLVVSETPEEATLNQLMGFAVSHGGTMQVGSLLSGTRLEIFLPESDFTMEPRRSVARRWILVVSHAPDKLSEIVAPLEQRGVVSVMAPKSWETQLNPNWFQWDAVLIHMGGEVVAELLESLRARKLPVKTIIYLPSGDINELNSSVTSAADLLIAPDLAQGRVVEKIVTLFT